MSRAIAARTVIVVPDAEALAEAAAARLLARVSPATGRKAVVLSGGATPQKLFRLLAGEPWRSAIPWQDIHWFWGDERFVAETDPRSNFGIAKDLLFDRVPAPRMNIHPIPTDVKDPDRAAALYAAELARFYGAEALDDARPLFDLVLLGVGPDGHTASLFPGSTALEETRQWVVGVAEAGWEPFIPRVSQTFPALASCREMLFLVAGAVKRDVLARVFSGSDVPAARADANGELVWLIDEAANPGGGGRG